MKNINENELRNYIFKKLQEGYFDEFEFDKDAMKAAMADIKADPTAGEFEELGSSRFEKNPEFKSKLKFSLKQANRKLPSDEEEVEHYIQLLKKRKAQEDRFGKGSLNEDEFDIEVGRVKDSKGNHIKRKSQVIDKEDEADETAEKGYVKGFQIDHNTDKLLVLVDWPTTSKAVAVDPKTLVVTGGELRELDKSTYNNAAAKAVEKNDNELAINFLKHSNEMGIEDDVQGNDYHDRANRYMFFSNLEQIRRQAGLLLDMDEEQLSSILENGHDWAQDHIATAKESIDQVFDFFMNETKSGDMWKSVDVEDREDDEDDFEEEIEEGMGRSYTVGMNKNEKPVDYPEELMREAVNDVLEEVFGKLVSTTSNTPRNLGSSDSYEKTVEKNLGTGMKFTDIVSAVKNVLSKKGSVKSELEKLRMKNWKGTEEGWHEFVTNKKFFAGTNESIEEGLGKYYVSDSDFNKTNFPELAGKFFEEEPTEGVEFEEIGDMKESSSDSLQNKHGKNAKPNVSYLKKEGKVKEIAFLQDNEANYAFTLLKQDGPEEVIEYLKESTSNKNHKIISEIKKSPLDKTYEKDGYTLAWNSSVGYVKLYSKEAN